MPGGRPTKPLSLVTGHRTNAEKEIRAEGEKNLLSGIEMQEWTDVKKKAVAHREFQRLKDVFIAIGKNDALHEGVINRYCLLTAECKDYELMKSTLMSDIRKLAKSLKNKEIDFLTFIDRKDRLQAAIFTCDKKIMERRKMLLDIEKENSMTITAALRSIPKKPEKKEQSKMAAMLEKRQAK